MISGSTGGSARALAGSARSAGRYGERVTGDGALLLHMLPLAAGAAISPALVGASVEILTVFPAQRIRMVLAYLAGAALVLAAAFTLTLALPQRASTGGARLQDGVDLVLAAVLLILAALLVLQRHGRGSTSRGRERRLLASRWRVLGVVALGMFMMMTNISTLTLVIAGAHEAIAAGTSATARVTALALLALGALLPVVLPLLWAAIAPRSAARGLGRLNSLLQKHGRAIGITVCLVTAAYLIVRGIGVL